MIVKIPESAVIALKNLNDAGFEAYAVGGSVRDAIMGVEVNDSDVTTAAIPEQVFKTFEDYKTIPTGLKHGTVTALINGELVEITTFRSDIGHSDSRHPDEVRFETSLEEDLKRRDFTMNALCADAEGQVIDLVGGMEDIERRLIRAIGDPKRRFEEDALRILRAVRFSATTGFSVEKETARAVHEMKSMLSKVSVERIFVELKKLLCGEYAQAAMLEFGDVFEEIIPELRGMQGFNQHNFHHCYDLWGHTAAAVKAACKDEIVRLSALFHDCGKVDTFSMDENFVGHFYGHNEVSAKKTVTALRRLKADRKTIDTVYLLVKHHDGFIDETPKAAKRRLNQFEEENYRRLIALQRADTAALAPEFRTRSAHFDELERILDEVIEQEQCFSLKDLEVNGNDIMQLGFSGREIGNTLKKLLAAVMDLKVKNEKEELIRYIRNENE